MTRTLRFLALFVALVALSVAGCSSDGSDSSDGGSSETTAAESGSDSGGGSAPSGPELDASAEKIVAADSSLDLDTARCIVGDMTADGSIGMGEVLTMNFQDLSDNADRLQAAYEDGVAACT